MVHVAAVKRAQQQLRQDGCPKNHVQKNWIKKISENKNKKKKKNMHQYLILVKKNMGDTFPFNVNQWLSLHSHSSVWTPEVWRRRWRGSRIIVLPCGPLKPLKWACRSNMAVLLFVFFCFMPKIPVFCRSFVSLGFTGLCSPTYVSPAGVRLHLSTCWVQFCTSQRAANWTQSL